MFKDLKVVFMGTPDFALPALKMLIEKTNVVLVVTKPDKIVGRKKELTPPPVKVLAMENNIEVFQPIKIKEDYKKIIDTKPDIIITCAYGQIIPKKLLNLPKYKCINIHGSILPKYRGAAPIQWSIINGDKTSGITIMYMDETMDTGNIIISKEINIENKYVDEVFNMLSLEGASLLEYSLKDIIDGTNNSVKQDEEKATYARMLTREDEYIDLSDNIVNVYNKIRGLYPNAYINVLDSPLKILRASYKICNNIKPGTITNISKNTLEISADGGVLSIEIVKPFGKKEMNISSYLNGIDKEKLKNVGVL